MKLKCTYALVPSSTNKETIYNGFYLGSIATSNGPILIVVATLEGELLFLEPYRVKIVHDETAAEVWPRAIHGEFKAGSPIPVRDLGPDKNEHPSRSKKR